jgi:hypothetical protein
MHELLRAPLPTIPTDRCAGTAKTIFYAKTEARQAVQQINRRSQRTPMRAFRCGFCDYWHVGHARGRIL